MYYYQILLTKKVPSVLLTYKSRYYVPIGSLVQVKVRNSEVYGIVFTDIKEEKAVFDLDKIHEVDKIYQFILPTYHINFIKIFSANSFNSPNLVLQSILQPILSLGKRDFAKYLPEYQPTDEPVSLDKTDSDVDDTTKSNRTLTTDLDSLNYQFQTSKCMRIIYIIRTYLNIEDGDTLNINKSPDSQIDQKSSNILIVFPEKKYLDKIKNQLMESKDFQSLGQTYKINIFCYTGDQDKSSKTTTKHVLSSYSDQNNGSHNLFFVTRSGIFLPFQNLKHIILVDESNSFYIQEQNSLYFDTREAVTMLSQVYNNCSLSFLSYLPSVRLHNFHSNTHTDRSMTYSSSKDQTGLNLKVSEFNRHFTKNTLFGPEVEELLSSD